MTTKIYCTFFDNSQISEYNLKETDILKLYNSNDLNIKEENINYLNPYICELVTYYYIWKNHIKSDYVGFCHYRRHYNKIYYDYIDDNHIQCFKLGYLEFSIENEFQQLLYDYFKIYYPELYNKIKFNKNNKYPYFSCLKISYIMTWDVFNDICNFIFGFFDFVGNTYNKNWKIEMFDINKKLNVDNTEFKQHIGVYCEFFMSLYIGLKYQVKDFNDDIKDVIIYNTTNKQNLFNSYKRNLKTGCKQIFNISNSDYIIEEIGKNRITNIEYNDDNFYMYYQYDTILLNLQNIDINYFINKVKLSGKNPILLNDNEYVECEMFSNYENYKIKNID